MVGSVICALGQYEFSEVLEAGQADVLIAYQVEQGRRKSCGASSLYDANITMLSQRLSVQWWPPGANGYSDFRGGPAEKTVSGCSP